MNGRGAEDGTPEMNRERPETRQEKEETLGTEAEEIREAKRQARTQARTIRDGMSREEMAEASRIITQKVLALAAFREARVIMSYVSLEREPDTREIIRAAAAEGKQVLIPRCVDRERMEAVAFQGFEQMHPGRMGIPEPEPGIPAEEVRPELILIPCMAATRDGKRLGHGAGYYDRFLAGQPGKRVCLCFRKLMAADLPTGEHDERMDLVITEAQEEDALHPSE